MRMRWPLAATLLGLLGFSLTGWSQLAPSPDAPPVSTAPAPSQDEQAVAQSAGHDDRVQAGELVGDEVVVRDATAGAEIFWVGSSMYGARRRGEAHAIRRSDTPRAPELHERQRGVCGDDPRTGGGEGFWTDEVLTDPGQALPAGARAHPAG